MFIGVAFHKSADSPQNHKICIVDASRKYESPFLVALKTSHTSLVWDKFE